jgi:hypothetical protein
MLGCTILGREEKAVIAITLLAILFCRKIHTTVRPLVRLSLTKEIVELELHKMKSLQLSMDLSGEDENRDMLSELGTHS